MAEKYYTPSDLAKRWGCKRQVIGRLLEIGVIPHVWIAGRRLIPVATCPRKRPILQVGRPRKTAKAPQI